MNGEIRESKRMRLVLTSAHRKLHNEMHRRGRGRRHLGPDGIDVDGGIHMS